MSLIERLLAGLAYVGVGLGLLLVAAYVMDLITPGRLMQHVFGAKRLTVDTTGSAAFETGESPSASAALVLAATLIGQGLVIFTAIWQNADASFGAALGWTIAFGLIGIGADAAAFMLLDLLTPGKLGEIVCQPGRMLPAAAVAAAAQLAVAGIVVASIA